MTSKKNTRRALLSSVVALILCCSMLVGTTFAWFTDEVKSMNNVITAGNLDVEVYNANGSIADPQNELFAGILWEPGVVAYETLTVKNVGSLALSYRMTLMFETLNYVVRDGVQYTLADVLQVAVVDGTFSGDRAAAQALTNYQPIDSFTLSGELLAGQTSEETVTIVIYWAPDANEIDNLYNVNNGVDTNNGEPLQINLGVNVFATQLEAESDSFDNTYDEAADRVITAGEIVIFNNEDIVESYQNNGTLEVNGGTMNNDGGSVLNNYGDATLNDVTITTTRTGGYTLNLLNDSTTVLNETDVNASGGAIQAAYGAQVIINGGEMTVGDNSTSQRYCVYAASPETVVIINDGTFRFNVNMQRSYACAVNGATIIINGGDFGAAPRHQRWKHPIYENGGEVIITGGTFGFDPTEWVAEGYKATKEGSVWTVGPAITDNTGLQDAVGAGETVLALGAGEYTLPAVSNADVSITGTEDTVITINKPAFHGSDVTLNGVTVKGSGYATGIQHVNTVTYNDVTVVGEMCLYGEKVVFNNCTFELNNQYIWTYGAKEVEFNNCTFNTTGKAILVYNEGAGASKVTVKNCTFNATAGAKAGAIANQNCAAIEIDNFQSSGVGAAHVVITENNTVNSNFSGEWRIKNFVAGNPITVNGSEYTQIAVDGHLMTIDADKNVTVG